MAHRYHAPAVAYDFVRPRGAAFVLCGVGLGLLLTLLMWCLQPQSNLQHVLLAVFAMVAATALLYKQWSEWPQGRLLWDGEQWMVEAAPGKPQIASIRVGLDGGRWLWLETCGISRDHAMRSNGRVLWIFLSQQHSPRQWGDLRRAVYWSVVQQINQG